MPKRPYPRWQRRHQTVLELLLENPRLKLEECARATGYSRTHVSRIVNSPDFRERYERARKAIEQEIRHRYLQRFSGLTPTRRG